MAASRLSLRGKSGRGGADSPAVRLSRNADALAAAGRHAEAEAAYRAALAADPAQAGTHNNHGNALRALGRTEEAVAAYRAALAHGLDVALVHYNLASALRQVGRLVEADAAYRRALAMQPDHAEAWNNRANLLRDQERLEDAAEGYRRAVALRPGWDDAHDNFGSALYLLHERGRVEAAARLARLWRRDHPGNAVARHIGAAIAGDAAEARAPDAYVRQTFDLFAGEFDEKLAELGYRAPELLARAVAADGLPDASSPVGSSPVGTLDVLDAGCGTGLCAAALRPLASRLTGVDLSGGMLERARARGLYDRLEEAELVGFLAARPAAFDLIVAADVLCYFGVLDDALAAAAAALRPGGRLAFTVEALEEAGGGPHRVGTHGRYAHREAYVRATLAAAGLAVATLDHDRLRMESGVPVAGLVVLARKPTPAAA